MSDQQYDDGTNGYDDEDTAASHPPPQHDTPPRGVRTGGADQRSERRAPPVRGEGYGDEGDTPYAPTRPAPRAPTRQPRASAPREYDDPPAPPRRRRSAPAYYPPEPTPRSTRRPPRAQPDRRRSGLYLPWWSLLIMLVFVGCAAVGALLVVNNMESSVQSKDATPVVIVITSTFTVGPPATPTAISAPPTITPPAALPTIPPTASLPPGNFAIGKIVQVVGVGESGLNVHSGAGVSAPTNFRAKEGDRFVIQGGPQTLDGYEWWQIQDQNNPTTRSGWAARNYLQTISTPTPPPSPTLSP